MNENKKQLEIFDSIYSELKFVVNSLVRLKILATLYVQPLNMKELKNVTGFSYSSISSNMHCLEFYGFVYRAYNKYYLNNTVKIQIESILELNWVLVLLDEFFNIINDHIVENIPDEAIHDLYLLNMANLMESNDVDVYKTINFIEDSLDGAENIKCIIPFYHSSINNKLNELAKENKNIEVMIPKSVFNIFRKESNIKNLLSFDIDSSFLLIVTDEVMIFGLFKDEGYFDQNRLIISQNEKCFNWAYELYEKFKNEYK